MYGKHKQKVFRFSGFNFEKFSYNGQLSNHGSMTTYSENVAPTHFCRVGSLRTAQGPI